MPSAREVRYEGALRRRTNELLQAQSELADLKREASVLVQMEVAKEVESFKQSYPSTLTQPLKSKLVAFSAVASDFIRTFTKEGQCLACKHAVEDHLPDCWVKRFAEVRMQP